jgi:hypothetical protein
VRAQFPALASLQLGAGNTSQSATPASWDAQAVERLEVLKPLLTGNIDVLVLSVDSVAARTQ